MAVPSVVTRSIHHAVAQVLEVEGTNMEDSTAQESLGGLCKVLPGIKTPLLEILPEGLFRTQDDHSYVRSR